VQKSLALPAPFGLPGQQFTPADPHVPAPLHRLLLQNPSVEPHELPVPMQRPPTQQRPWPQELRAQQGWFVPPQFTIVPLVQTLPPFGPSPLARHVPVLQHPPPVHVLPVQQAWPGAPHARHVPALQRLPAPHMFPVQHGWLVAPQAAHVAPVQTLPALHVLPVQHAWVAPPHTTQLVPLQTAPALHVLPAQQAAPTTPQTPVSRTPVSTGASPPLSTTSTLD
jgi:hypothetical protein